MSVENQKELDNSFEIELFENSKQKNQSPSEIVNFIYDEIIIKTEKNGSLPTKSEKQISSQNVLGAPIKSDIKVETFSNQDIDDPKQNTIGMVSPNSSITKLQKNYKKNLEVIIPKKTYKRKNNISQETPTIKNFMIKRKKK